MTICGRGYAARLLDNESRPVTYQGATLAEIVRCHAAPYGISCAEIAPVSADSVYTVAAGTSQWKALEGFCRTYGGFSPRFRRDGLLVAAPERDDGRRIVIDGTSPILSCTLREDHYGVLTEVLVIDKTRNVSYSVQNRDMLDRGGQCRRVVYTPGQSTWAAMRYTGEYQIRQSREEELTIELGLAGCFPAFPGDTVRLELGAMGLSGEYRVAEAENTASPETGEVHHRRQRGRGHPGGGTGASGVWPRRLCVDAGERRCGTGYQRWPWRGGAVRGGTAAGFDPGRHGAGGGLSLHPRRKQRVPAQRRRDRAAGQSAHPGQPDGERGALCALRELRGDGDGTFPAEWRLCA